MSQVLTTSSASTSLPFYRDEFDIKFSLSKKKLQELINSEFLVLPDSSRLLFEKSRSNKRFTFKVDAEDRPWKKSPPERTGKIKFVRKHEKVKDELIRLFSFRSCIELGHCPEKQCSTFGLVAC